MVNCEAGNDHRQGEMVKAWGDGQGKGRWSRHGEMVKAWETLITIFFNSIDNNSTIVY